ncbi:hypothetical protein ABW19_dt0208033 [Dactylella cylindrospora]|nr:hypothetical protein ABW19_dt0208033 [Dactylella cylindrospora]
MSIDVPTEGAPRGVHPTLLPRDHQRFLIKTVKVYCEETNEVRDILNLQALWPGYTHVGLEISMECFEGYEIPPIEGYGPRLHDPRLTMFHRDIMEQKQRLELERRIWFEDTITCLLRPEDSIGAGTRRRRMPFDSRASIISMGTSLFGEIPLEIFLMILEYLEDLDALCLILTCTRFYRAARGILGMDSDSVRVGRWAGKKVQYFEVLPGSTYSPSHIRYQFRGSKGSSNVMSLWGGHHFLDKIEASTKLQLRQKIFFKSRETFMRAIPTLQSIIKDEQYPNEVLSWISQQLTEYRGVPVPLLFIPMESYVARCLDKKEYIGMYYWNWDARIDTLTSYHQFLSNAERLKYLVGTMLSDFLTQQKFHVWKGRWVDCRIDIARRSSVEEEDGWVEIQLRRNGDTEAAALHGWNQVNEEMLLLMGRTIEENCPQIAGEDSELWIAFIRRDFGPEAADTYRPSNPANWYKVYRKLQREQEKKDQADIEKLKADMAKLNEKREKRQVGVVNGVRRQDVATLKRLDRGAGGSGGAGRFLGMNVMTGRVTKDHGSGPFKNSKLNKILTKGMKR